jgi:enoyl-CoA hydratase/carnithine racemase
MANGDWFIYEMEGKVAVLTLNHPDSMNIVNQELFTELHELQNRSKLIRPYVQ